PSVDVSLASTCLGARWIHVPSLMLLLTFCDLIILVTYIFNSFTVIFQLIKRFFEILERRNTLRLHLDCTFYPLNKWAVYFYGLVASFCGRNGDPLICRTSCLIDLEMSPDKSIFLVNSVSYLSLISV
uniref:Uncharacterized protein n=1 Tax=Parascaris univalens TaxID=6257 RepID=A0A915A2J6_PARUN